MIASRWREKLIGNRLRIIELRKTPITDPPVKMFGTDILQDMTRTFPRNHWFLKHMENITMLLNSYAYTNSAMGYAQGMAFIVFILYKTFHEDIPKYALQDTYYAFHRIVGVIRPIYPLGRHDLGPQDFIRSINQLIYMKLAIHDTPLACRLKTMEQLVTIIILQCLPALFSNKFKSIEDGQILFDYIFSKESITMFNRIINVFAAILIHFRPIIMSMEEEKVMQLMQVQDYYKARKIIATACAID